MQEEVDDNIVHHDDFTLSTEWEKFIDRLEKVVFRWKLSERKSEPFLKKEDYVSGYWETATETVDFADFKFDFRKYCLKPRKDREDDKYTPVSPVSDEDESSEDFSKNFESLLDLYSPENCFIPLIEVGSPDMYCIVRWYGLREFLVLSPQPKHSISSESRLKILLSSVLIALNNCSCSVPVFVQFNHPSNRYFVGVSEGSAGIRVDFEMVHCSTPPPGSHLSGLLDMFKYKIRDPTALKGRIQVSAQFTYKIKNQSYTRQPPVEFIVEKLPFKTYNLTLWEIHLMATWPLLPEDALVDRIGSSSFHPLSAPLWSVRMPFISLAYPVLQPGRSLANLETWEYPIIAQYLINCISCTSHARDNVLHTSIIKLIGGADQDSDDPGLPPKAALDILTNSKVSDFTKVVNKATKSRLQKLWHGNKAAQGTGGSHSKKWDVVDEGPISDEKLLNILHFLFPDADEKHEYPYPSGLTEGATDADDKILKRKNGKSKKVCPWLGKMLKISILLKTVQDPKTCPVDSLLWRMALALSFVHHTLGGPMAAAHLWYEVAQEARYRWDKLIPLPGLVPGDPDHKTSLLYQKFQMLNCCIERRKKEKDLCKQPLSHSSSFNFDSDNSEDEDDNFFDCPEVPSPEEEDEGGQNINIPQVRHQHTKHSLWNRPEGRLTLIEDVCILNTGEPVYVPITQEIPPKTEDQLEEDAQLMLMLGNDSLGAELRASIMSASLLSDMESFKAANPSAELIDFIRWYSPRDWVEEEMLNEFGQKKGHLSERMLLPGNKWQEVWSAAKPVPARRQKRLFNEGCEAEKVLHFLEVLSVSKVFRYLLPVIFQEALCRIGEEMEYLESLDEKELGHSNNCTVDFDEQFNIQLKKGEEDETDGIGLKKLSDSNTMEDFKLEECVLPSYIPPILKKSASRIRNLSLNPLIADQKFYLDLVYELAKVESSVSMARGVQKQFNLTKEKLIVKDYFSFLKAVTREEEANIIGGRKTPLGDLLWNFIQKDRMMEGKLLDEHFNAEQKEYVLQVMAARPAPYSRPTPQRLNARVKDGEFRLAGAFSQDTIFF